MTLHLTAQKLKLSLKVHDDLHNAEVVQETARNAINGMEEPLKVLNSGKTCRNALNLNEVLLGSESLVSEINDFLKVFAEDGMVILLNPAWTELLRNIDRHATKVRRDIKSGYKAFFKTLEGLNGRVEQLGDVNIKRTFNKLEVLSGKSPIDDTEEINRSLGTTGDPSTWLDAIQKRICDLEASILKEEKKREALPPEVKKFQRLTLTQKGFPLEDLDGDTLRKLRGLQDFDQYVVIVKGGNG
jgi:hypothetical protein